MTPAMSAALKWMRAHSGDAAVARCQGGGRVYLAHGDTGPFMPSTARALIDAGLAEYIDQGARKNARFRLTEKGMTS